MIDLNRDGYYVIKPEDQALSAASFVTQTVPPELSTLQGLVGGFIEHIALAQDGWDAKAGGPFGSYFEPKGVEAQGWINEEGKVKGLPFNPLATAIMRAKSYVDPGDYVVGTMVIACGLARSS